MGHVAVFFSVVLFGLGSPSQSSLKARDDPFGRWAQRESNCSQLHHGRIREMKRLAYVLLVGVLLLSLGSGNAFAQATASGTIQGTVTDKSGAVVSGAQIVAKSKATDSTRAAATDDTGYFRFELLPVGIYTV